MFYFFLSLIIRFLSMLYQSVPFLKPSQYYHINVNSSIIIWYSSRLMRCFFPFLNCCCVFFLFSLRMSFIVMETTLQLKWFFAFWVTVLFLYSCIFFITITPGAIYSRILFYAIYCSISGQETLFFFKIYANGDDAQKTRNDGK